MCLLATPNCVENAAIAWKYDVIKYRASEEVHVIARDLPQCNGIVSLSNSATIELLELAHHFGLCNCKR